MSVDTWTVCEIPLAGEREGEKTAIFGPTLDEDAARQVFAKSSIIPAKRELWHGGRLVDNTRVGKPRRGDEAGMMVNEQALSLQQALEAQKMLHDELRGRVEYLEKAVLTMAKRVVALAGPGEGEPG